MQISRVISEACDSANMCVETENCDADDCFPLQQKLLVCTLIMLCKNIKCKETSLGKVSTLVAAVNYRLRKNEAFLQLIEAITYYFLRLIVALTVA